MPTDKSGKFHMNPQRAHAADKNMGSAKKPPAAAPEMHDGAQQHEGGSSIHEHLAAMHAEHGGKHMHVKHDGMSYQSHHVGDDGQVQGPHDHQNLEELKQHMDRFFDEESGEWSGEDYNKGY